MTRRVHAALLLMVAVVAGACGGDDGGPVLGDPPASTASSTSTTAGGSPGATPSSVAPGSGTGNATSTTSVAPTTAPAGGSGGPATSAAALATFSTVRAPNGRSAPRAATTPEGLAAQIQGSERALRNPATPAADRPDLGHVNQVAYRALSTRPEWDAAVLAALDADLRPLVQTHLRARREFIAMRTTIADTVPAWQVMSPESADALLGYFKEAEAATGIGWQYLAAINLVETGFGRIDGLSTASAIGPMQFLQGTWNERGIGEGDIRDPHDAIQAAARYLVRRGGPADMAKALQGYNNHANYVRAVTAYAELFKADERSYRAVHEWEIYYFSSAGDLWLPAGYRQATAIPAKDYVRAAPWSAGN